MRRHHKKNYSGSNIFGQLFFAIIVFIGGICVATFYDISQIFNLTNYTWLNDKKNTTNIAIAPQNANAPKPKFEFYTLLTHESVPKQVGSSEIASVAQSSPRITITNDNQPQAINKSDIILPPPHLDQNAISHENYLVQVGSFRYQQEASKLQASLIMKGHNAIVTTGVQNQVLWYRVAIGPFVSKIKAIEAQRSFAQMEHIIGMIKKVDT